MPSYEHRGRAVLEAPDYAWAPGERHVPGQIGQETAGGLLCASQKARRRREYLIQTCLRSSGVPVELGILSVGETDMALTWHSHGTLWARDHRDLPKHEQRS